MPSPKRRAKRYVGALTVTERAFLTYGEAGIWAHGDGYAFRDRGEDPVDERAARAAWAEHRLELVERHAPYTCWAAREYEGAPGDISPHEHLKGLRPKPRGSSSQSHGRNDGTRGDYD